MAVRKPVINPKEAVRLIKMGFSDEGLMEKYSISARGLESLFGKLVQSGELTAAELEQRMGWLDRGQSVILSTPPLRIEPKIQIGSREAVEAIRSGMSDLELMRKFSLSAKGIDKLFKKLIHAGHLDRQELEQRAYASHMFQVAELDELPEPIVPKPRVKAAEAVRDIRAGMCDAELTEKYGLSSKGLESLFRKLVHAGEIMQAELDQRLLGAHSSHYVDLDTPVQPSDAKCRIIAAEAMEDIRSGMSDAALMKKYDISVQGLSSLFRKLLLSGRMEQAELDRRSFVSQQSHFVDLEDRPEPAVTKTRVKASELAACVRNGMDDAAVMERFNVSARGLGSLLRKLVAAGRISQKELDARKQADTHAEPALARDLNPWQTQGPSDHEDENGEFELAPPPLRQRFAPFWQDHKRSLVVAGLILLVGVGATVTFVAGWHETWFWHRSGSASDQESRSPEDLRKQAAEVTTILENISNNPYRKADLAKIPGAENLQECLKSCGKDHASSDATDRGLLINCRMECMARHGKAIKAIRKRYYEDDPFE